MGYFVVFFFQAEDGIRDLVRSRGLGDVYKRQTVCSCSVGGGFAVQMRKAGIDVIHVTGRASRPCTCLLYTSDAADDLPCVDLGGRRIFKKKNTQQHCNTV